MPPFPDFAAAFQVEPGSKFKLDHADPAGTLGFDDEETADSAQTDLVQRLSELSDVFYADHRFSLLIVLQGIDTAGKDGTIRHLLTGVNPRNCRIASFKEPSPLELSHDFLWRVHAACPARGELGVFNRSHYEDVLVVRVHKLVPRKVWSQRFAQINDFEKMLDRNNCIVLKFMLHISKKEQKHRLEARLDDKSKNWKMSPDDLRERRYWDRYMDAYQDALRECSTRHAPWYVIPSNKKWFRNLAVTSIVVDRLKSLRLAYPKPSFDLRKLNVS